MNTERRVQEKLNKFRQAREIKLGAIEDAINAVKRDLAGREETLISIIEEFNDKVNIAYQEIGSIAESLQKDLQFAGSGFNEAEADYLSIASELEEMGIDYDNAFPDLGSDWKDIYDTADELIYNLKNN